MRNRKRGASKAFLRAIRRREAQEQKARIMTIDPFEDAARGRDSSFSSEGEAHEVAIAIIPKRKNIESHNRRLAPGVCGPEGDSIGAAKRGRGRPRITEPRPWEVAGISRRTWYRRRDK